MMVITSAPGKLILLGEHAVVFGRPAIAVAIDLRLRCMVTPSVEFRINGNVMDDSYRSYIQASMDRVWRGDPLSIRTRSELPSGSGMGSSAAVTVATLAALMQLRGMFQQPRVARLGFEVESEVQGRASPIDTSVSTHGHGIFIDREKGKDHLWSMTMDERTWNIHHLRVPRMTMVVGYTSIHASTGPLVDMVRSRVEENEWAREAVDRIGDISLEGMSALRRNDLVRLGELMDEDHGLLSRLGVSCPELDSLVEAARPLSYGAKLTGAGGGGSMIALTDSPERVSEAIEEGGGEAIIVHTGVQGVSME
jgi:mevalonate kinase